MTGDATEPNLAASPGCDCCGWDDGHGADGDGDGAGDGAGDGDGDGHAAVDGLEHAGSAAPSVPGHPSIYTETRAQMERRDFAKVLATVGGLTAVASLGAPLSGLTRVFERSYEGPIYSDGVALVTAEGEPVAENHLAEGEWTTVFPETHPGIEQAPTLLVRFPEDRYGDGTNMAFTVSGYAAYSKVCTHAGCMVSDAEGTTLVCPCHVGKFDPLSGASVVGGPPPRPLPQLPITLSSDGELIATGDFEGPVGAGGE